MSRPSNNPLGRPEPQPNDAEHPHTSVQRPTRPLGVFVIAAVLGLEALGLAAAGIGLTVGAFTQTPHSVASAVFLIVLVFALAVGLAAVAFNAFKGFRWTRSAAFVWQLLMVAIAMPALLSGATLTGLVLLIPALAAAYYLFTPKVVAFSLRAGGDHPVL
ncbi:hypothetical protein [Arthrobacter sp. GMC3]|uniref:hypothetical protein n=1 Tax=Arthrobacter sp. GMC3 TaxID=2058894 RepID=UPI000CE44C8B|nr:hypothetical protein [Arthrobacter sp. GMC3]